MLWYKYIIHVLLPFLIPGSYCSIIRHGEELLSVENFNKTWIYFPNDEGNLYRAIIVEVPEERMFIDVPDVLKYTLHTRECPDGEILTMDSDTLEGSCFNFSLPTKIVTHGWMSNGRKTACENIKLAYMEEGDYNVIIMDWEPLSTGITYVGSVYFVDEIGTELAKFVDNIICQGVNPKDIHMIGHSLGAHIMGEAGRNLGEERVHRITGLDPAGPLFNVGLQRKLTKDSADFVDVIHTAAGSVGYRTPLGTADFYPNGGRQQPGCKILFLPDISCDHAASWKYFRSSIRNKHRYAATKCRSFSDFQSGSCDNEVTYMGEAVSTNVIGKYFLEVTDKL